jgi:proteic killer suppression protein
MIVSFRHKGLRRFFETGSLAGIQPHHAHRLQFLLTTLTAIHKIEEMDKPGFQLHLLRGIKPPRWTVEVNGNWRLTFQFDAENAHAVDYEDYH